MKSIAWAVVLLFQSAPVQELEKQLLFEAPKGTSDADRLKAAKALAARCLADVTGDTISRAPNTPKQVRLRSAKGFDKEALAAVDFLASFPCKTVAIRFERHLTDDEWTQYKRGEKAPTGCSWVKHRIWEFVEKPFPKYKPADEEEQTLLLDKPVIDTSGKWKLHRHAGGDLFGFDRPEGIFLTFKGTIVKTIYGGIVPNPKKPGKTMLPLHLVVDGVQLSTDGGSMGWRHLETKGEIPDFAIWEFPELRPGRPLVWLLENPLPFELKRVAQ